MNKISNIAKVLLATWMIIALMVHAPMLVLAQSGDDNKQATSPKSAPTADSDSKTADADAKAGDSDTNSQNSDANTADPKPHIANDLPVTGDNLPGVPLTVGGVEIVRFMGTISGFTPEQRVRAIIFRLHELEENPSFSIDSITTKGTGFSTDVVAGKDTVFTITDRDARLVGEDSREVLATECAARLKRGLLKEQEAKSPKVIFMASVFTAAAFVVLLIALSILAAVFPWLYRRVESARGKYIGSVRIQKAELLSEDSLTDILIGFCRIIRAFLTVILLTTFVELVLGFYPTTRELSGQVTKKFMFPMLHLAGQAVTSYVPNLLIIITVIVGAYYLIGFTRFIFSEIGRGSITFSGFEQEWATPTYTIVRFLIIAFAIVLMFPYLPGSGSPAFQQVSIFLGVLISLGSSGAVSNVIAGVFLTYTGAFRLGDRVRIADTVGDVTERRLLYTRIRTIKDEFITIPNSLVLGAHIINYSASMQGSGLVLHTSVTIGYDVEWRTVEKLLIEAAKATENIRDEPPPFVLVTSLDDFFVTHQINAFTSAPHSMAQTYAALHKNILDKFFEAGVEIMSPHVHSIRDGSDDAIPSKYRKEGVPKRPSMSPYVRK